VLEDAGYCICAAEHGRAALDLLSAGLAPALILLDLLMPVMDGWSFVAELKKDPVLKSIPVVVTTQAGKRVLSSAPVSAGYLDKPISQERLLQTVARCLLKKRP